MGIKKYKPTTPSLRNMATLDGKELTKDAKPLKNMLQPKKSRAGRNAEGRITVRRRGGGVKKRYRLVDFKRSKTNIPAVVQAIVYDPNRSCNLAQVAYADGEKNYILAPLGSEVSASERGVVTFVGNEDYFGELVIIKHLNNWVSSYAHLDKASVLIGDKIEKGDIIGTVGTTGIIESPQLYFELRRGTIVQDPTNFLN